MHQDPIHVSKCIFATDSTLKFKIFTVFVEFSTSITSLLPMDVWFVSSSNRSNHNKGNQMQYHIGKNLQQLK